VRLDLLQVREVVTILDIDAIFYPCPQGGPTFRPKAKELSGKSQFPFMVDPNTGTSMLESDDIIKYLVNKYGDGTVSDNIESCNLVMLGEASPSGVVQEKKNPGSSGHSLQNTHSDPSKSHKVFGFCRWMQLLYFIHAIGSRTGSRLILF
jgi:hypothetical protein